MFEYRLKSDSPNTQVLVFPLTLILLGAHSLVIYVFRINNMFLYVFPGDILLLDKHDISIPESLTDLFALYTKDLKKNELLACPLVAKDD